MSVFTQEVAPDDQYDPESMMYDSSTMYEAPYPLMGLGEYQPGLRRDPEVSIPEWFTNPFPALECGSCGLGAAPAGKKGKKDDGATIDLTPRPQRHWAWRHKWWLAGGLAVLAGAAWYLMRGRRGRGGSVQGLGETIFVSNKDRGIVTRWGAQRGAREVKMSKLSPSERAAAKSGELIITDCPPSGGRHGSTERRVICRGGKCYTRK